MLQSFAGSLHLISELESAERHLYLKVFETPPPRRDLSFDGSLEVLERTGGILLQPRSHDIDLCFESVDVVFNRLGEPSNPLLQVIPQRPTLPGRLLDQNIDSGAGRSQRSSTVPALLSESILVSTRGLLVRNGRWIQARRPRYPGVEPNGLLTG